MKRFKLFVVLYNNYYDYYNRIGKFMDDRTIRRVILDDIGCIDGDDNMYFSTVDKKYNFKIYRTENYYFGNNYNSIYNIYIEITDNIGVPVLKMNFDINTCIEILYNISICPEVLIEDNDNNYVYINPNNSNLNAYMISITAIFGNNPSNEIGENSPIYNLISNKGIYDKDVRFEIFERSYIYDNVIPMVSMDMTYEELSDFCFRVFFVAIMDLDIPDEFSDKMETIENFCINNGNMNSW
jgi:hypothetical protein